MELNNGMKLFAFAKERSLDDVLKMTAKTQSATNLILGKMKSSDHLVTSIAICNTLHLAILGFNHGALLKINLITQKIVYVKKNFCSDLSPINQLELFYYKTSMSPMAMYTLLVLEGYTVKVYNLDSLQFLFSLSESIESPILFKDNSNLNYEAIKNEPVSEMQLFYSRSSLLLLTFSRQTNTFLIYGIYSKKSNVSEKIEGSKNIEFADLDQIEKKFAPSFELLYKITIQDNPINILGQDKYIVYQIGEGKSYYFLDYANEQGIIRPLVRFDPIGIPLDCSLNILYILPFQKFLCSYGTISDYFAPTKNNLETGILIQWENVPQRLIYAEPYVIAILENSEKNKSYKSIILEIRNIFEPNIVFQRIPIKAKKILLMASNRNFTSEESDNYMVNNDLPWCLLLIEEINGKKALYSIRQKPIPIQLQEIIEQRLYHIALRICDINLSKDPSCVSSQEYKNLQRERAFYCFIIEQNYKLAYSLFKSINCPLAEIILLFSELILGSYVEQLLQKFKIDISQLPFMKAFVEEESKTNKINLLHKAISIFLPLFSERLEGIKIELEDLRTKCILSGHFDPDNDFDDTEEGKLYNKFCLLCNCCELLVFHGCLIIFMKPTEFEMTYNEAFAIYQKLLKGKNSLSTPICGRYLNQYKMEHLIPQLHYYQEEFGQVFQILKVFYTQNTPFQSKFHSNPQDYWMKEFIRYSHKIMNKLDEDSFLDEMKWIFEVDKKLALECFKPPSLKHFSFSTNVCKFIEQNGGIDSLVDYLEFLSYELKIQDERVINKLGLSYITQITTYIHSGYESNGILDTQELQNNPQILIVRNKFIKLVEKNDLLNISKIFPKLPPIMSFEKAILLIKNGKYSEGFSILIFQLRRPMDALQFGERLFDQKKEPGLIISLVECLFKAKNMNNSFKYALSLIRKHYDIIPLENVLRMLPENLQMREILPYFHQYLSWQTTQLNQAALEANLLKYMNLSLELEHTKQCQKFIRIDDQTRCKICYQPISNLPFYHFNGEITHYFCIKKKYANSNSIQRQKLTTKKEFQTNQKFQENDIDYLIQDTIKHHQPNPYENVDEIDINFK